MEKNISLTLGQSFAWQIKYFWFGDLCSSVFLFIFVWHFFCCCTCLLFFFFHFISFCCSFYFSFMMCAIFLLFVVDFFILMSMFIITRLYWDGLFTKKEFIPSLSCVSGAIIVSVLDVRWFIEVKTSTDVSPISFDSLFW